MLRETYTREGRDSRAQPVIDALLAASPDFAALWLIFRAFGDKAEINNDPKTARPCWTPTSPR